MLGRAGDVIRPGGRLIYATCSSEPEENEAVVARFLAERRDFTAGPVLLPSGLDRFTTPEGWFRTFPFRDRLEPFFAAMLVKTKDLR
jgi:16S rRNA (cytosine967-C5)-methyltransferase